MANGNQFISSNWQILASFALAVFTAGGIFAEFTALKNELTLVHDRLDEKVLLIDRLETRILDIEKELEYEKGFIDGRKK
jgi:hypothetical protein|tara:strand:+ start:2342 stop:2581 length:240 start_codon:yes stop_codon:yes gene_type:complete